MRKTDARVLQQELKLQEELIGRLLQSQRRVCQLVESGHRGAGQSPSALKPQPGLPLLLRAHFSVLLGEKRCFLGNTLAFRLFVRLHRCPNEYVSYEQLRSDVWQGHIRTRDAIRSTASSLRKKLRAARMSEVAAAVDGSVAEHYAFIWPAN